MNGSIDERFQSIKDKKVGSKYLFIWILVTIAFFFIVTILYKFPVNWGLLLYSGEPAPILAKGIRIVDVKKDTLIHSVRDARIWASSGYEIIRSDDEGKTWINVGTIPYPLTDARYLKKHSIVRKLFGSIGVDLLRVLKTGTILAVCGTDIWRSEDKGGSFKVVHRTRDTPKAQGWTEIDGEILYGEYVWPNSERERVHLWKSTDDGRSWFAVYTFGRGAIRHIHSVQHDPYANAIWITTGDKDGECKIMYSSDRGETFTTIGEGSQKWRAVSLLFTQDCVYWGTDTTLEQNYIYRWNRAKKTLANVKAIDGPAWYSTKLEDGSLVLATTVEDETDDDKARIWYKCKNRENWEEIGGWKKIPGGKGYGIIRFAHPNNSNYVYITPLNTDGHYSLFKLEIQKNIR